MDATTVPGRSDFRHTARSVTPGTRVPVEVWTHVTDPLLVDEDGVRSVREYIRDGETFQANVCHRLVADAAVPPVGVYDAIRAVNPAPYSVLFAFPGVDLVRAGHELLPDQDGDRLETEPIAGTRPRDDTEREDRRLEAELLADEKERAEHAMLVDLERNDLVMGARHRDRPHVGVQFHPESIPTDAGKPMVDNFVGEATA